MRLYSFIQRNFSEVKNSRNILDKLSRKSDLDLLLRDKLSRKTVNFTKFVKVSLAKFLCAKAIYVKILITTLFGVPVDLRDGLNPIKRDQQGEKSGEISHQFCPNMNIELNQRKNLKSIVQHSFSSIKKKLLF